MLTALLTLSAFASLLAMAAIARLVEAWHAEDVEACWP